MDFSKFDNRAAAETGIRLELVDPDTGEPITNDKGKPCAVTVRGVASRTVQAAIRARQKARVKKADGKKPDDRIMEDVHDEMCDAAAPLIVSFENIERDGKACVVPDDVEWFLDLTFPIMGLVEDEDGDPVLVNGEPKFEMKNNPFAKQITEAASKMRAASGNVKAR